MSSLSSLLLILHSFHTAVSNTYARHERSSHYMPKFVVSFSFSFSLDVHWPQNHPQTAVDAPLLIPHHLWIHWLLVHPQSSDKARLYPNVGRRTSLLKYICSCNLYKFSFVSALLLQRRMKHRSQNSQLS